MVNRFIPSRSNRRQRISVPDLLWNRQQYGFQRTNELAGRIAWNSSRMQNMILSVGPGTPASVIMSKPAASESGSSASDDDDSGEEGDNHDSDDDDDHASAEGEQEGTSDTSEREQWLARTQQEELSNLPSFATADVPSLAMAERVLMEWMDAEGEDCELEGEASEGIQGTFVPAIRHGGCINTACWLTTSWRLSLRGKEVDTINSNECPTQLVTSGDDHCVKFWDARYSMGTSSPFSGGKDTVTPFSSKVPIGPPVEEWSKKSGKTALSGSVIPLATLETKHTGNVFHITPLQHNPGKVVTCAADGYVRISDLESGSSSIVVSPEYDHEIGNMLPFLSLRPGMCFSHHLLDQNMGLLCSERGLRRFDLRMHPREQRSRPLLGNARTCRSCAIWSSDDLESSYVFCGGSSATVGLYDLRMTDLTGTRVVQKYLPRSLTKLSAVSVNGLDLSKDKRELLVSYENDQIYTFPIFPNNASSPTVDELNVYASANDHDEDMVQSDLASFGGHLNRSTFLQNAKYAGPNDEYICTGSDSGHAWIYERATGAIVSFIYADHSTCNGVIPHPSLPFFITYGIDSTAKLWRATLPVDCNIDDSPLGRARHFTKSEYEKSPLVASWSYVKDLLGSLDEFEDKTLSIFPNDVPLNDGVLERGIFSGLSGLFFRNRQSHQGSGGTYIGNDLRNLPNILRQNLFACVRAFETGEDDPIRSSLSEFKRSIAVIRLNFHAAQRGLISSDNIPWILRAHQAYIGDSLVDAESNECPKVSSDAKIQYGDSYNLIPEYPSDWLPFDSDMTSRSKPYGFNLNLEDFNHLSLSDYSIFDEGGNTMREWKLQTLPHCHQDDHDIRPETNPMCVPPLLLPALKFNSEFEQEKSNNDSRGAQRPLSTLPATLKGSSAERAWLNLFETVEVLKVSGNLALRAGSVSLAARLYDQALQYCAVAFMSFQYGDSDFFHWTQPHQFCEEQELQWSPLLKLMLTTRLNLSMALLKISCKEPKHAGVQAMMALLELDPFVQKRGEVRKGGHQMDIVHNNAEPESTYEEAKALQAKAFFRLGSSLLELGDYGVAVKHFEASLECTCELNGDAKPDPLLILCLAEAKRENNKKAKQQRKRFRTMLAQGLDESPPSSRKTSIVVGNPDTIDATVSSSNVSQNGESSDAASTQEFRFNFSSM